MAEDKVKLGRVYQSGDPLRDAIHVPIAAVVAGEGLQAGDWVTLRGVYAYRVAAVANADGIVDPFLGRSIDIRERVYVLLKPGSVTKLRHEWDHPKFDRNSPYVVWAPPGDDDDTDDYDDQDECAGCYS